MKAQISWGYSGGYSFQALSVRGYYDRATSDYLIGVLAQKYVGTNIEFVPRNLVSRATCRATAGAIRHCDRHGSFPRLPRKCDAGASRAAGLKAQNRSGTPTERGHVAGHRMIQIKAVHLLPGYAEAVSSIGLRRALSGTGDQIARKSFRARYFVGIGS